MFYLALLRVFTFHMLLPACFEWLSNSRCVKIILNIRHKDFWAWQTYIATALLRPFAIGMPLFMRMVFFFSYFYFLLFQMKQLKLYIMLGQSQLLSLLQTPLKMPKLEYTNQTYWRDFKIWDMTFRLEKVQGFHFGVEEDLLGKGTLVVNESLFHRRKWIFEWIFLLILEFKTHTLCLGLFTMCPFLS